MTSCSRRLNAHASTSKKVIEWRELRELGDDGLLAYISAEDIEDGPLAEFSVEDIREVIDELDRAYGKLSSERDRESAWMCIPSIPILAILQSELTSALEQQRDALAELYDDIVDERIAEDVAQRQGEMVVMRAWGPYEVTEPPILGDPVVMRVWGPYEVTEPPILGDPRWLWMNVVKAWYRFKDKVAFGGLPEQPVKIADDARIVLVGDWGSGLKRAREVARQIRAVLNQGLQAGRQATRNSSRRCVLHRLQERV